MDVEIFIGWDPREQLAWRVCARSLLRRASLPPAIAPITRANLELEGLYRRPTERRDGRLWDVVSGAPMSTEFALARFFVPLVARSRWALFIDGDFMFRADVAELLAYADPRYAVQVVKHDHRPQDGTKMDGQKQIGYERKNWSSCVLWNLRHAGSRRLLLSDLTNRTGLWLHQFGWLKDHEIGELPEGWNWLEGHSGCDLDERIKAVHFTNGTPDMPGYSDCAYAAEWRGHLTADELRRMPRPVVDPMIEAA